jgi:hypothetical protein
MMYHPMTLRGIMDWYFGAMQSQYATHVKEGETLPSGEQVTIVEEHYKSR